MEEKLHQIEELLKEFIKKDYPFRQCWRFIFYQSAAATLARAGV